MKYKKNLLKNPKRNFKQALKPKLLKNLQKKTLKQAYKNPKRNFKEVLNQNPWKPPQEKPKTSLKETF